MPHVWSLFGWSLKIKSMISGILLVSHGWSVLSSDFIISAGYTYLDALFVGLYHLEVILYIWWLTVPLTQMMVDLSCVSSAQCEKMNCVESIKDFGPTTTHAIQTGLSHRAKNMQAPAACSSLVIHVVLQTCAKS
ncbi:hypothetical protein TNCT_160671 [Trichonephila clavata]|uniref:Uncharacterized protein n=1 Tax=Trichonephila clavata TaxID=2740835 RepID=A0A8X6G3Q9_TRICU|nr:hypothetical protein TNCT_160671 [Trichonephila clavata]